MVRRWLFWGKYRKLTSILDYCFYGIFKNNLFSSNSILFWRIFSQHWVFLFLNAGNQTLKQEPVYRRQTVQYNRDETTRLGFQIVTCFYYACNKVVVVDDVTETYTRIMYILLRIFKSNPLFVIHWQVHACNILRALYRETKLGEEVFPFVSDGVVVAIKGFHSESWAVSKVIFVSIAPYIFIYVYFLIMSKRLFSAVLILRTAQSSAV